MNFANRTIWTADNIEILPGIDSECVDLIYLDPPFNSNRDYAAPIGSKAAGAAFKDTWTLSDLDVAAMGRLADTQPRIYAAIDAAGQVHGKSMMSYLCMMADRLVGMPSNPQTHRQPLSPLRPNRRFLPAPSDGLHFRQQKLPQ